MAVQFSGSLNLTGSLQTTGSILLIGNETITGSLFVSNNIWSNGYKVIESSQTSSMAVQFSTDLYIEAKNTTGTQINKGKIVRIIGATGDSALIGTASWDNDLTSAETIGWTYENIANDAFGKIILYGKLIGVNTDGMVAGDVLYLSSSGNWTNIKPHAPNHMVIVGQVLRVQQNNGSVAVKIQNGYELDELHNLHINTSSLAHNQLLAYSGSVWRNETIGGLGIATTGSNTFIGNQITTGSLLVTGSITINSGSITMPNRPAFRVIGTGGPVYAQAILSGSQIAVDYNQGNHFNPTNGLFTAPIAGLYQVNTVIRTHSNTNSTINQLIVYKSGSNTGGDVAQIMVEFGINTTMNHAGGSTISKLEVGDTLRAQIAVGTCSFDVNDNFSVAYIG